MELFFKISAAAIITVILCITLKPKSREYAAVLSLCSCAILLLGCVRFLQTIFDYTDSLKKLTGLELSLFSPLVKTCGLSVLTQMVSNFCHQSGEPAIGKIVELCGNAAAVCTMIPIMDSLLTLVKGFLGE